MARTSRTYLNNLIDLYIRYYNYCVKQKIKIDTKKIRITFNKIKKVKIYSFRYIGQHYKLLFNQVIKLNPNSKLTDINEILTKLEQTQE